MAKYITVICRVKGQTVLKLIDDFDGVEDNVFYYHNDCEDQTQNGFDLSLVKQEVVDNEVETQNKFGEQSCDSHEPEDYFDANKSFEYLWNEPTVATADDNQTMDGYKKYLSIIKSTGRQMFLCRQTNCNYQTLWKNAIVNHIRSNHQHFFPFVCSFADCTKKFAIRSNLNNHQKVHSKRSALLGKVPEEDSSQSSADHNYSQNVVKKRSAFKQTSNQGCSSLSDNKTLPKNMTKTIKKQTFGKLQNKKRNLLKDNMKNIEDESNHSTDSQSRSKKVWPSSSQKPAFVGIKSVEQYIETTERSGSLWRMCRFPECSYGTRYATSMVYHIRNQHLNDKPYVCAFCGKRFAMRTNLNNHKKVHKSAKHMLPDL